jgi:hypothetical protein
VDRTPEICLQKGVPIKGDSPQLLGFPPGKPYSATHWPVIAALGFFLFQVFRRTVARRPGLDTWAGHRSVGFCFQSLPLMSLVDDFVTCSSAFHIGRCLDQS